MAIITLLGDFYHGQELLTTFVNDTLTEEEIIATSIDELAYELEKQPKLFVSSKENRTTPEQEDPKLWLTSELDQALWDYVSNGGNMLILHGGLSAYPENSRMRQLAKGHFIHHPAEHLDVTYSGIAPDSEGVSFHFLDEHYFVEVDEADTEVFLKSTSTAGEQIAACRHKVGKGRVLILTPTHRKEGFENEAFKDLFKKSVTWLTETK